MKGVLRRFPEARNGGFDADTLVPADFRVPKVAAFAGLRLLLPDVVDRRVEVRGVVGGGLLGFVQNGRLAALNKSLDLALCV